ncbi:MAG TPA: hypothetical protein VG713_13035 [Pirellulales bacterium]|nr:hypothetical protein [Pirellulales bacterium]
MPTETIEGRGQYLLAVVDNLLKVRNEWIEGEGARLDENEPLWQAIEETIEAFGEGAVPANCRKIESIVVRELKPAWSDWKNHRFGRSRNPVHELPGNGVWKTIEAIEDGRQEAKARKFPKPESVAELKSQKVSDAQICRIWGWVDSDGRPDFDKLREEIEEPGKHTSNYVHPMEQRAKQQAAAEQKRLAEFRSRQRNKLRTLTQPSKETTEDLIRQGVSASQIAKLRKITVDEVYAEADALGLPRPQLEYKDVRTARAPVEHEVPEEVERSMRHASRAGRPAEADPDDDDFDDDEDGFGIDSEVDDGAGQSIETDGPVVAGALTIEQEIIQLSTTTQMTEGEIANAVSTEELPISRQKVTAVLKRFRENPAEFNNTE